MPGYDFRCKNCGVQFTQFYKSYSAYDAATPGCPNCQSTKLTRVINRIHIQAPSRDFTRMSSDEMLSVLESGDSQQVGTLFEQIGGTSPELGAEFHETTQRLLQGESMDSVEKSLQQQDAEKQSKKPNQQTKATE